MLVNENTLMSPNMRQSNSALRIRNGWAIPPESSIATNHPTL